MRTDVKVGLVCAFAIVLGVIIFFVVRGKQPVAARAEMNTSHSTTNSDLRPASAGTPSNPTVSSDPILPDHTLAGNPIGGGVIAPPGSGAPAAPAATSSAPSMLTTTGTPGTPSGPGTTGITSTPLATSTPTGVPTPTSTSTTPTGPTMVFGSGTLSTPTSSSLSAPLSSTGATTYKIQKGDMLIAIAKKNNISLKALQIANPGVDASRLKVGDVIKIPAATATATPGTPSHSTTPTVATSRPSSTTSLTSAHPTTPTSLKPGSVYVIKKGDTLLSISKAAYGNASGTTKIFRANRSALDDPDVMPVGASIKIP